MRTPLLVAGILTLGFGLAGAPPDAAAQVRVGVAVGLPHFGLYVPTPLVVAAPPYYLYSRPYGAYAVAPFAFGIGPRYYGGFRGPYVVRHGWR